MKKIVLLFIFLVGIHTTAFAKIKEVVQEASGSGATQQQAISQALLTAVQAVNGTSLESRVDYEETVSLTASQNGWKYSSKVSPVFSVQNNGSGAVTKFQVLNVSGSNNQYRARVRAYVAKFESEVHDQHQKRIAILPFHLTRNSHSADDFSEELSDLIGTYLSQSGQLSVVDRQYIAEMADENAFLRWDGAPQELARIGQKVGADYLLVGKINALSKANSQSMYGLNQNADQVRLTWRIVEANTSKVVAAGTLNKVLANNAVQNILNNGSSSAANQAAEILTQDILVGLKLQSRDLATQQNDDASNYEMTPGSSEKPIQW